MHSVIYIIETSQIISEGLYRIISHSGKDISVTIFDSLHDIPPHIIENAPQIIIINPLILQAKQDVFRTLKKELPNTKWAGLVYAYFEQTILAHFDFLIHINDSEKVINETIDHQLSLASENEDNPQQALSDREVEVLRLLVTGHSNKEIAEALFISPHTVITHRKNITQKTGIKTVSGLTIYAVLKNIITLQNI
jgi:DNA-binding NarL/FixJ family response regulator